MTIILSIVLVSLFIDFACFFVLTKIEQEGRISVIFRAQRLFKLFLLVELNVLNFSFVFIPTKLVIDLVLVIAFNVIALFYFALDLLYLSERRKEYLLWLQENVFASDIYDIFDLTNDDGSKYEEAKVFSRQTCSVIKKEHKLCIQVGKGNNKFFLVPKTELSKETLALYCQKFELDAERKGDLKVYKGDVIPIALKEYDNSRLSKTYLFLKNKVKPKLPMILSIALIGVSIIAAVGLLVCDEVLHIDPFGWMGIEL